jgi:regulator of protease activity HflC (stomatin/prohibitin superfamily)
MNAPAAALHAVSERAGRTRPGIPFLVVDVVLYLAALGLFVAALASRSAAPAIAAAVVVIPAVVLTAGFYMVQPNQAAVLTLFGDYRGTDRETGLRVANPLYRKRRVSLRVRNFTTETSKVNDANGNPIEIAAVVVWRVTDTARAVFAVDDYVDYVHIQSESGVRQLARSYPYDSFEDDDSLITLIGDTGEVNEHLLAELHERAAEAGVEIVEARLTDLSYAPEIAEAMLRRQQASAVVAARAKIVEGAVLMVREAIEALAEGADGADPIELDSDRRATFAANLMTVIASDQPTSPVVNVGTLMR